MIFKDNLPAAIETLFDEKGAMPLAIKSAFTYLSHLAYCGRKLVANVVFPAPFAPDIIWQYLSFIFK